MTSEREFPWVDNDQALINSKPDPEKYEESVWFNNDKPVRETDKVAVYNDKYPCKQGHRLYITKLSKDNPEGIGSAFQEAFKDGMEMIAQGKIDGFNMGMNIGASAGQSVFWPHVHFIPRQNGDQEGYGHPRGVRQAFPPDPYSPDNKNNKEK